MDNNPVGELVRIFDLLYDDAYCLTFYVAPSDVTWTTEYVIDSLSRAVAPASDRPMLSKLLGRLRADQQMPAKDRRFGGIIGNIGWFVYGVASALENTHGQE